MSKLYLSLDEQGRVIGMGDNPDVYPHCIEAPEWFDPGQHFKTGRVVDGVLVVDLDGLKTSRKARIKAEAARMIEATDWKLERAREREAAGWATLAEVDAVLAEREAIRRSSSAAEAAVDALTDAAAVQSFSWSIDVAVAVPRRLTHKQFMDRFSEGELTGILAAVEANAALKNWWAKFQQARDVNLDDPATQAGVQALEIAGLLAAGRAKEVLA